MARETSLWDWLAKARKQVAPGVLHMNRVENYVEAGMADVDGYLNLPDYAGEFNLELKSEERPARSETPLRFKVRDAQVSWNNARWALGANNFWLLQVGSGSSRTLYLAPGDLGKRLQKGMHEAELAVECIKTGIFKSPHSQLDILKKAITCRANKYLFPN